MFFIRIMSLDSMTIRSSTTKAVLVIVCLIASGCLSNSNNMPFSDFPASVCLSGELLFMGFPQQPFNNQGVVGVFSKDNGVWGIDWAIQAPDVATNDRFGSAVHALNSTVVIGAPNKRSASGSSAGMAFVYAQRGSRWILVRRLIAADATVGDKFGYAVFITANLIIIGAPQKSLTNANAVGAVYIYGRGNNIGNINTLKITPPNKQALGYFGYAVAASDKYILIGSVGYGSVNGQGKGAVYAYSNIPGSVILLKIVTASNGQSGDYFGSWISLSPSFAVVSAFGKISNANGGSGSIYVFDLADKKGALVSQLNVPNSLGIRRFSARVSISETNILVGAIFTDPKNSAPRVGAVLYSRAGNAWVISNIIVPKVNTINGDEVLVSLSNKYAYVSGLTNFYQPLTMNLQNVIFNVPKTGNIASATKTKSVSKSNSPTQLASSKQQNLLSASFTDSTPSATVPFQATSPSTTKTQSSSASKVAIPSASASHSESSLLDDPSSAREQDFATQSQSGSVAQEFVRRIRQKYIDSDKLIESEFQVTDQFSAKIPESGSPAQKDLAWVSFVVMALIGLAAKTLFMQLLPYSQQDNLRDIETL